MNDKALESKKTPAFLKLTLSIIVMYALAGAGEMQVRWSENMNASVPTYSINKSMYASLPVLADVLGYSWKWNEEQQTFRAIRKADTISCSIDRTFMRLNDRIVQIPSAPIRHRGTVLLPIHQISGKFSAPDGSPLRLNETDGNFVLENAQSTATNLEKLSESESSISIPVDNVWGDKGIQTIVIDPGHGGKDPGAVGAGGVYEKNLVLGIGLALRDRLQKKNFSVYMTRETDRFLSLKERTAFANKKKADLFISIHADAIPGSRKKRESIKGFKVYFLSDAKSEEDRLVAMRENAVVELEENNESEDYLHNILTEMISTEHLIESQDLSIMIAESFARSLTETRKLHRGVGQARFYVLNGAFMPAVLVETGFVSNPGEAKLLSTKKYQKKMADALLTAILDFKRKYEIGL